MTVLSSISAVELDVKQFVIKVQKLIESQAVCHQATETDRELRCKPYGSVIHAKNGEI